MSMAERRTILGSLMALLATPLVFGKEAVARTLTPRGDNADPEPRLKITPPAHSVKRRG
jgi:hypothetical protein